MISIEEILVLSAENCFITIARNTSERVSQLMQNGAAFPDIRRVIVGAVRQNRTFLQRTIEIYNPPRQPDPPHTGMILARFQIETFMNNRDYQGNLRFDCRLVTGSPMENLPYTLILTQCHEC